MLKAKQIEHAPAGMHADGNGLYLKVSDSGAKSWIFRFQLNSKRREMGLGALSVVDAPTARNKATELKLTVKQGIDPLEKRNREAEASKLQKSKEVYFADVAIEYIESHRAGWKNAKHAAQWGNTLDTYAFPIIGKKTPGEVTTEDMLRILKPIWQSKTETASRVRNRIELVWSYAKARKFCQGENPAAWRGHLDALLPKPAMVKKVRHHPALHHDQVPAFLHTLRAVQGAGARCLELAILTATRSQESRLATWQQFDLTAAVWEIPPVNMKAGKPHRVPLPPGVVALLQSLPRIEGTDLVFPGMKTLKPLSDMALTQTIRRMDLSPPDGWRDSNGDVITAHGFRSSFRDWAGETTNHVREVVEHALAHQLPDKAEASYARGTLFDKRRQLMNDWASHCLCATSSII